MITNSILFLSGLQVKIEHLNLSTKKQVNYAIVRYLVHFVTRCISWYKGEPAGPAVPTTNGTQIGNHKKPRKQSITCTRHTGFICSGFGPVRPPPVEPSTGIPRAPELSSITEEKSSES